jgi:hypothetical protein
MSSVNGLRLQLILLAIVFYPPFALEISSPLVDPGFDPLALDNVLG